MDTVSVKLRKEGMPVAGTQTDFDGNYTLKSLVAVEYSIYVNSLGYKSVERIISVRPVGFTVAKIDLRADSSSINIGRPVIEIEGVFGETDGIMIGGVQQVDLPGLSASQGLPVERMKEPLLSPMGTPIERERLVQVIMR